MKTTAIVLAFCLCALAAGCADTQRWPRAEQPRVAANYLHYPDEGTSPEWSADHDRRSFRNCRVDTVDCLDLDERPFRACLLDSQRCPPEAERIPLRLD